jgi:transcriptional regulator with XRE-family HTH domain
MGVDATTVRNWESGRRQLTLDRLLQLAQVLNVSATYLLGLDERVDSAHPIDRSMLPVLHRTPVWTASRGWALVNSASKTLLFADKSELPFDVVQEPLYAVPPAFALSLRGIGDPLSIDAVCDAERVWVEPISDDAALAAELRGWYRPYKRRFVENEFGQRFYLDVYGAKWLAFAGVVRGVSKNGAD